MEQKKITKKEYFNAIRTVVAAMEVVGDIAAEDVVTFIDKQIEQIDAKAAKAKAKAGEKKAEGDALREAVAAVLTDEYQTVDAIVAQVEGEDITKSKVVARLTQLIEARVAIKEQVKDEATNRKVMAYKLA